MGLCDAVVTIWDLIATIILISLGCWKLWDITNVAVKWAEKKIDSK